MMETKTSSSKATASSTQNSKRHGGGGRGGRSNYNRKKRGGRGFEREDLEDGRKGDVRVGGGGGSSRKNVDRGDGEKNVERDESKKSVERSDGRKTVDKNDGRNIVERKNVERKEENTRNRETDVDKTQTNENGRRVDGRKDERRNRRRGYSEDNEKKRGDNKRGEKKRASNRSDVRKSDGKGHKKDVDGSRNDRRRSGADRNDRRKSDVDRDDRKKSDGDSIKSGRRTDADWNDRTKSHVDGSDCRKSDGESVKSDRRKSDVDRKKPDRRRSDNRRNHRSGRGRGRGRGRGGRGSHRFPRRYEDGSKEEHGHTDEQEVHKGEQEIHRNEQEVHRNEQEVHRNEQGIHKDEQEVNSVSSSYVDTGQEHTFPLRNDDGGGGHRIVERKSDTEPPSEKSPVSIKVRRDSMNSEKESSIKTSGSTESRKSSLPENDKNCKPPRSTTRNGEYKKKSKRSSKPRKNRIRSRKDGLPVILTREDTVDEESVTTSWTEEQKERSVSPAGKQQRDESSSQILAAEALASEEPEPESTITQLTSLSHRSVSITSTSTVTQILHKSTSQTSLASSLPSIQPKKKKKKKKAPLSNDSLQNQTAAREFNRAVRACVERSDPDTMYTLLHDPSNHNFALDKMVTETVMKAYVMAAMFEDALYCLRNCTLPGTLATQQTERILSCLPQNLRNSSAYTAADMINALCIATEFESQTARTYFMRIVRGIALEFLEEATSARDRICSAPCERLVRSAQCVVDAKLVRGKKAADLIVQPGNQLGVFVPETLENRGIQAGDAVSILPYAGPYPMSAESLDRNMIEATVTNAQPLTLRLQDRTNANLYAMLTDPAEGNVYRIDKLANRMGFNRQLAAAVAIAYVTENETKRPSKELIRSITAMDENIDRVMLLEGGFHLQKGLTSTAALCAEAVKWEGEHQDEDSVRAESHLALEKYGVFEGLNVSQRLAVEGAATNRLTLVQGPPGTGKTAVAIRILQHWARLAYSENGTRNPILATSDSNIAVDNLVEGCAAVGLKVVRLGRPEAIRPELLQFCIDRPQASHYNGIPYANSPQISFKEKMKILKSAQVICCTCIGSGGDILENITFERVLVDEATQATEPAVLVPISRGCKQLVLVGDHCQLPPTVLSTVAEEEGLGVPLFSRMVACGVPPFMLDTQYRMHPGISMFPSDLFYGGKLRNGVSPPERRPLAGFPWPREEFPVAFVPVNHGAELDDGVSKLNEAEAAAACDAVAALLNGGQCTASDIAVVTPYAAQVRLIRRMTRKLVQRPPYVEVSSTDGFQGREKEAVVFSAVRSNDYGALGFVSDWRRVNVSFTRARRALIVIGNDLCLRRGDPETWMPWLAWADAHGVNMDKPGVPRGRYDAEQLRRVRGGTTAAEMLKHVLERQQAQLKVAKNQLEKAEKNAIGHIMGCDDYGSDGEKKREEDEMKAATLEEDLALLANEDGCWDDSEKEEEGSEADVDGIGNWSSRQPTLCSTSSGEMEGNRSEDGGKVEEDEPTDAWDL